MNALHSKNALILLVLAIVVLMCGNAAAADVYAFIVSKDLQQTQDIIASFKESFPAAETATLDLQGKADADKIQRFLERFQPSVIICLGTLAAKATVSVEKNIPILFAMVINYKSYPELQQSNVAGVMMEIPLQTMMTQFKLIAPDIKRIGIPHYSPGLLDLVTEAEKTAQIMGMEIVDINVKDPDQLKGELKKKGQQCSALWMIGDTQLYNKQTEAINNLVAFSKDKKIPLFAFSEAFLKPGAFFSISIDYNSLGSQLALLSRQMVEDKTAPGEIGVGPPIGTFTVINRDAADAIYGSKLNPDIFDEVDKSYPEENEK